MKSVDLSQIDYTGADIVGSVIEQDRGYANGHVHFRRLNLIKDDLPKVDLVFCRDCLVHLSDIDALMALDHLCRSGARYLLTTTFPHCRENRNIATGRWRMVNLEIKPFAFPPPIRLINEECSEGGGAYEDKSLGLWRIADL